MLTDTLTAMVNNPFKENFYEKKKINVFTFFSISYKNSVKISLKWLVNHCPKGTH